MMGRIGLGTAIAFLAGMLSASPVVAQNAPGVTKTSIKIGNTIPYSGPASAYAAVGKGDAAYFKMINDQGGVNGRKIDFISLDDGYSPPKTVEQTRRLVERDQVAFIFNSLGTPPNSAIQKYLNDHKIPQLFIATGADKWGNYKEFPWTMGWQPSYRIEAQIYAKQILAEKPDGKIGILYQNDDFGKDYILGVKDVLGAKFDKMVVTASYEVTDPTIDSQAESLKSAGVSALIAAVTPKFAAQMIRKVSEMDWKPLFFLSNVSISVGAVIEPAGPERAVGIITAAYLKDPGDPTWANDPGMQTYKEFFKKYLAGADVSDIGYEFGYSASMTLVQVLKQCGGDLSRENVMKQATNLHDLQIPTLLPGITIDTSPTNYHPIRKSQLARWNGKHWELFGKVIEGAGT
ncbi:MAG: ABC transporter substrate-binding protein [Acetobacteraceae bacterium]|nr:ABC transporter substrate-binding protein [Acetobacteraceae bacterium]